jgi:hypothetical protein
VAAAAALVTILGARPVSAQGAADFESARTLYRQGLELRASGNLAESLERLRAAQALALTPLTTLEVGRGLVLVGKLVEAREALLAVGRLPHRLDESPKSMAARDEASELARSLAARIPTVMIRLHDDAATHVELDGLALPTAALLVPRAVDPGHHVIVTAREGRSEKTELDVAEGQNIEVQPRVPEATAAPPAAPPEATTPPPSIPPRPVVPPTGGGLPPLFWSGVALAGAGTVVGAVAGVVTLDKASTLKRTCGGGACPASEHGDLTAAQTAGTVSTIAFSAAGAGAVLAIAALVSGSSSRATTAWIRPCALGAEGGLCGSF